VGSSRLDERTMLVGTGGESADDWLIREAPGHPGAWLVTSDRALREAAGGNAGRLVGGGTFLRGLDD
jgi:rRNA-processing protein FCF1